jgi:hypothetical protein
VTTICKHTLSLKLVLSISHALPLLILLLPYEV